MKTITDLFLEREREYLSPFAFFTANTKGREHPYERSEHRTEFQRDRDRILHSKSFRRLMHKTQVFFAPEEEHYRTRMTHTLEVTQIARIMARALSLNEDLTEAAALGHDLGHTPFGHAGERAMTICFSPDFTHYAQSLRVVDLLENDGRGLNLTYEVRDGILNHTGSNMASTLEGIIVKFADRIAYVNHDIDDACRAGILAPGDIPKEIREVLGNTHSERINTLVSSVVEASRERPKIAMTPAVGAAFDALRTFMYDRVYTNPVAKSEEERAVSLLCRLYEYYVGKPNEMPGLYVGNIERDGTERCVCDFISGMSDRYAIETYRELFIPKVWRKPTV